MKDLFTPGPYTVEDSQDYSDIGIAKEDMCLAIVFNADSFPCSTDKQAEKIKAQSLCPICQQTKEKTQ